MGVEREVDGRSVSLHDQLEALQDPSIAQSGDREVERVALWCEPEALSGSLQSRAGVRDGRVFQQRALRAVDGASDRVERSGEVVPLEEAGEDRVAVEGQLVTRVEVGRYVVPADPDLVGLAHRGLPGLRPGEEGPRRLAELPPEGEPQYEAPDVELVCRRVPASEGSVVPLTLEVGLEMVTVAG